MQDAPSSSRRASGPTPSRHLRAGAGAAGQVTAQPGGAPAAPADPASAGTRAPRGMCGRQRPLAAAARRRPATPPSAHARGRAGPTSAGLRSGGRWPAPSSSPPGSSSSFRAPSASCHFSAPSAEGGTRGRLARARPRLSPVLPDPGERGQGCRPAAGSPQNQEEVVHPPGPAKPGQHERKTPTARRRRRQRASGGGRQGRDRETQEVTQVVAAGHLCHRGLSPGGQGQARGLAVWSPWGACREAAWLSWGLCKVSRTFPSSREHGVLGAVERRH